MKKKKILLTGASGFLGYNLFLFFRDKFRTLGTYSGNPLELPEEQTCHLDIRDEEEVKQLFRDWKPDVAIHAAGVTSPAFCRKHQQLARAVNVEGSGLIAREARRLNCRVISMSTDRVFGGEKGNYLETDRAAPCGYYGETKLESEQLIRKISPQAVIFRLPLLYGRPSPFHDSFVSWMIEAFRKKEPLHLFTDQFRTPLYVGDVGTALTRIIEKPDISGLFHLGGPERISRSDFGYRMAEIFDFDPGIIRPIKMEEKPHLPPSPADASLNSEKLYRLLNFSPKNVEEGLRALKKDLEK